MYVDRIVDEIDHFEARMTHWHTHFCLFQSVNQSLSAANVAYLSIFTYNTNSSAPSLPTTSPAHFTRKKVSVQLSLLQKKSIFVDCYFTQLDLYALLKRFHWKRPMLLSAVRKSPQLSWETRSISGMRMLPQVRLAESTFSCFLLFILWMYVCNVLYLV